MIVNKIYLISDTVIKVRVYLYINFFRLNNERKCLNKICVVYLFFFSGNESSTYTQLPCILV